MQTLLRSGVLQGVFMPEEIDIPRRREGRDHWKRMNTVVGKVGKIRKSALPSKAQQLNKAVERVGEGKMDNDLPRVFGEKGTALREMPKEGHRTRARIRNHKSRRRVEFFRYSGFHIDRALSQKALIWRDFKKTGKPLVSLDAGVPETPPDQRFLGKRSIDMKTAVRKGNAGKRTKTLGEDVTAPGGAITPIGTRVSLSGEGEANRLDKMSTSGTIARTKHGQSEGQDSQREAFETSSASVVVPATACVRRQSHQCINGGALSPRAGLRIGPDSDVWQKFTNKCPKSEKV
ncbi:hypothetical protein EDB89DRAFT_1905556 [Lactarius sanguifluus]|nr:hypothetical protein EDB89DRAFT_1905556 [Lactarius sanguifluus]